MRERLGEILYFFRGNLLSLLLVTLPFAVMASLIVYWLGEPVALVDEKPQLHAASAAVLTLLYPFALGAKIAAIHQLATANRLIPAELVSTTIAAALPLLVVSIVIGAVVGFGMIFLFIIPGAWFYARLGLAPITVVIERLGAGQALGEAWRRSRPRQLELFVFTLLAGLVLVTGVLALSQLTAPAADSPSLPADILIRTFNELVLCVLTIAFYRYWSLDRPDGGNRSAGPQEPTAPDS